MFDCIKNLFKKNTTVEDNDPEIVIPSYRKIIKVRFENPGREYWTPIVIWTPHIYTSNTLYLDYFFSQIAKFYGWEEMTPGSMIVTADNEYIGVMAFDKIYKLPMRVKSTKVNNILEDVTLALVDFYKWEEDTKNDIK